MDEKKKISILFVCTGNSCRSQMAEGFMRAWGGDKVEVWSAGSHPAHNVARESVEVMHEVGIDISGQYPKGFDEVKDIKFDWVITLCDHARDFCPVFVSKAGLSKRDHWPIRDPHQASNDRELLMKAYRDARADIAGRIKIFLKDELGIEVK